MAIEVMLDIFSGLPNPVWELNSVQETDLLSRIETLPPAHGEAFPEPPGLGYRGFVIQPKGSLKLQEPVVIYKGVVQHANRRYEDTQRGLEKWLLESAGLSIPEQLKEVISREVEKL